MNEFFDNVRFALRRLKIGIYRLISSRISPHTPEVRAAFPRSQRVRFGPYEADLHTHELWRDGAKIKLVGQPFAILTMLLERPGELITRDELRSRLWPENTYVGFDHGLNAAVNKLRETLGDSAANPRYIETLPRRGYRFLGSVEPSAPGNASRPADASKPGPRLLPNPNRADGSYRHIVQRTVASAAGLQEMNG